MQWLAFIEIYLTVFPVVGKVGNWGRKKPCGKTARVFVAFKSPVLLTHVCLHPFPSRQEEGLCPMVVLMGALVFMMDLGSMFMEAAERRVYLVM